MNIPCEKMPIINLSIMVIKVIIQIIKNINGNSTLEFYVEERLDDRKSQDF